MQALTIKTVLHLMAWLPLPLTHAIGYLMAWALILVRNKTRDTAIINIQLCFPELSAAEQHQLMKQSMREMLKSFLESGVLWLGSRKRLDHLIKEVKGEEYILEALEKGKGCIFISPHIGCWEIIGQYFSPRYPMTALYRPPRMKALDNLIRHSRQRNGATLVPTTPQGIKILLKALKNNGTTGILPDQDPRDSGGHFAPFFGIQTNTMTLLSRLTQKTGATPLLAYAERLSWGRGFILHFEKAPEAIANRDMDESVTALNAMLEDLVRQLPGQYQWGYKRFRTRPPGEPWLY